jgi:hypothetical protein
MRRLSILLLCGCSGSTGGGLVTFHAQAGGPARATGTLDFDTGHQPSYHVTLSAASFHLGAVYFNSVVPSSGGPAEECIKSTGVYVGELFGDCEGGACGLGLPSLLTPDLVAFPLAGVGTTTPASEAEIWLSSGDIDADSDPIPVFTADGVASAGGQSWPFSASVTINRANRGIPSENPATPGANPICRQRIVGRIPVDLTLANGGTLSLRVDPAGIFNEVDFATLAATVEPGPDGKYLIPDSNDDPTGSALYDGVVSNSGVYFFNFEKGE